MNDDAALRLTFCPLVVLNPTMAMCPSMVWVSNGVSETTTNQFLKFPVTPP